VIGRRVLARTTTRTLATDGVNVYFGDEEQNALMMVSGAGGENPILVERPAPLGLALDGRAIAWIGRPGNVVRRVSRAGAAAVTLRDQGTFTSIAASRGDTFVTENVGTGSALTLLTGSSVAQVASFDAPARAVVVDDAHAYVVTASALLRVPRAGGNVERVASGSELAHPQLDRDNVYFTGKVAASRGVLRVAKTGGDAVELVRDVRQAPIAVYGNDVFFLDESKPELRRIPTSGGAATLAGRDEALRRVTALVVDESRITVGTERGGVIALARAR
jgi:hypothetical protein